MDSVHMPSLDSVEAGAPASEIEVTPAMIDAGGTVLWESGAIESPMDGADRHLVREIFFAMYRGLIDRS